MSDASLSKVSVITARMLYTLYRCMLWTLKLGEALEGEGLV